MRNRGKRGKHGRHGPAFVLIQLKSGPMYGLAILEKMKAEMPFCPFDTAAIYRALQQLEQQGAVEFDWDTSEPGPARKWYRITEQGEQLLEEFRSDIEKRLKNLTYFMDKLNTLGKE